jgi:hypothetical protein
MSKKKITFSKDDRKINLLMGVDLHEKERRVYNMSHNQVSPFSYNSGMDALQKSVLRNNNKVAKQTAVRVIDHSKWNSQHAILIRKGL